MSLKKNHASNWKVYCIIDKSLPGGKHPLRLAEVLFKSGVKAVQLRDKNSLSFEMVDAARKIATLAKKNRAFFL